jgi:transcriptional regulator with GAF, ATPase, and Fis domain
MAHRGTLFLDEIGDLPLTLQAKILRALEEKRFERVGGTQSLHVDVRVVAATNRNLKARVADRPVPRRSLTFRLSVFPVQIPPLRERSDDIMTLAHYFVESDLPRCEQAPADALRRGRRGAAQLQLARQRARAASTASSAPSSLTEGDTISRVT